jgi:hypothetical protein
VKALAPAAAATPFDPLAVTCLHDNGTTSDTGAPAGGTQSACDHCVLCAANNPPLLNAQVVAVVTPVTAAIMPRPQGAPAPPAPLAFAHRTPRGPPLIV